jgi:hypothetical protein
VSTKSRERIYGASKDDLSVATWREFVRPEPAPRSVVRRRKYSFCLLRRRNRLNCFRSWNDGEVLGRIRSCYISSPAGTDLSFLRRALVRRGIQVLVPVDLDPGANWSEWISQKIEDVDLVIGVLTSERRSQAASVGGLFGWLKAELQPPK